MSAFDAAVNTLLTDSSYPYNGYYSDPYYSRYSNPYYSPYYNPYYSPYYSPYYRSYPYGRGFYGLRRRRC